MGTATAKVGIQTLDDLLSSRLVVFEKHAIALQQDSGSAESALDGSML